MMQHLDEKYFRSSRFSALVPQFLITIFALVLDQLTKNLVMRHMHRGETIRVLGDFFRLHYIENPGIAFGIDLLPPTGMRIVSVFAVIVLAGIIFLSQHTSFLQRFGFTLILGGALGNLVDRLSRGRVVDFLDFGVGTTRFWTFNLADSLITVGSAIIVLVILLDYGNRTKIQS